MPTTLVAEELTEATLEQAESLIEACSVEFEATSDSVEAAYNLGVLLQYVGRGLESIEPLRFVIDKDPNFKDVKVKLGRALVEAAYARKVDGDVAAAKELFLEAASYFKEAVKADANLPEVDWELGLCLWELGEKEEATRSFRNHLVKNPSEEHIVSFAAMLNENGQYVDSIDVLKEGTETFPRLLETNFVAQEIMDASRAGRRWQPLVEWRR